MVTDQGSHNRVLVIGTDWSLVTGPDHATGPLVTLWRGEIALAYMVSDHCPDDYCDWTEEEHEQSNIEY
jgi:hypothetical protein